MSGCSGKDETEKDTTGRISTTDFIHIYQNLEPYKGWKRFRQGDIVIIHPPRHLHESKFGDLAKILSALSRQTSRFLRTEPPESTVIYFYTGVRHGMAVTGREFPFSDGSVIHFWFPSFLGAPLVKHHLPRWQQEEPKHQFLKHGIIALLDGSDQNYHQFTLGHIDTGVFIHLRELAKDSSINVDLERHQSAEAASFVDYVVYTYGVGALKELYQADGDFELDALLIFGLPVDSLEVRWLEFVNRFAGKPEETGEG